MRSPSTRAGHATPRDRSSPTACCATTPHPCREHTLHHGPRTMDDGSWTTTISKTRKGKARGKKRGGHIARILHSCPPCPLAKRLTTTAPRDVVTHSQTRPHPRAPCMSRQAPHPIAQNARSRAHSQQSCKVAGVAPNPRKNATLPPRELPNSAATLPPPRSAPARVRDTPRS
jgi:hypothetical protein